MDGYKAFEMGTGPYIPEQHSGYGLLPDLMESGGEVFSCPAELSEVDSMIIECEGDARDERGCAVSQITPYGYGSYAEYFGLLESLADRYRESHPEVAEAIESLSAKMKLMNVKEEWSIVRYVGSQFDDDAIPDLTKGRYYYWPCSKENPVYEGVVDNEEFTSYMYPCDKDSWEIVEDPTGMAARALAGDADTIGVWRITPDMIASGPEDCVCFQPEGGRLMALRDSERCAYSENDYFRMGAVVAVGELYDMAAFGDFLTDEQEVRSYLESFGVRGLDDVDALGIKGPYRRDFERLYLGGPLD